MMSLTATVMLAEGAAVRHRESVVENRRAGVELVLSVMEMFQGVCRVGSAHEKSMPFCSGTIDIQMKPGGTGSGSPSSSSKTIRSSLDSRDQVPSTTPPPAKT